MKEVTLTILERLFAQGLLNNWKGSFAESVRIQESLKDVAIYAEEAAEIGLKKEGDGDKSTLSWSTEKGKDKTINLNPETVDYLSKKLTELDETKSIVMAEAAVWKSLSDKLK